MTIIVRPYEILQRFDGQSWHVSARTKTIYEDGTERDGDSVPLTGQTSPVFDQIKARVSSFVGNELHATVVAERDALLAEKPTIQSSLDTAKETIKTLQARIAELEATPTQPVATLSQIRVWLIQNYGVGIIAQVNQMIEAIPNEVDRAIAHQQWEYANNVLRDNPFVLQISNALGLSTQQMDEAYLAATRIV